MARLKPAVLTFDSANTRHNVARMLAALQTPRTFAELEAELHMTHRNVQRYIAHLKAEPRRVRVDSYRKIGSHHHQMLALGSDPDCPAPVPTISEKERSAIRRKKAKADPEARLKMESREKARWNVKKAVRTANCWFGELARQGQSR